MLQPSPETLPATTPDESGDLAVVEAPTAALALREVQRRHGASARIVHAEKVLRGGLGGFFQRELVKLTVDVDGATVATSSAPVRAEDVHDPTVGQRFLSAVREAMARDADAGAARPQETFRELLDRAVGPQLPDGTLLADAPATPDSGSVVVRRSPAFEAPAPDPATASPTQPAVPDPHSPWRPAPRPAVRATPPGLADERRRRSADEVVGGLDAVIARLTADETSREVEDGADLRSRVQGTARRRPAPETVGDWRARAVAGAPPAWVERLPRAEAASLRPTPPEPVRPLATLADATTRAWHADVDEIDLATPAPAPVTFDERLASIAALREADVAAERAAERTAAAAEATVASDAVASVVAPTPTEASARSQPPAATAATDLAAAAAQPFRAELPPVVRDADTAATAPRTPAGSGVPTSASTTLRPERHRTRRDEPSPVRHRTAGPSRGSTRPLAMDEAAACRRMQDRLAHATTTTRGPVGPVGPWSLTGLSRLGVPSTVVDAVRLAAPVDDLGWFTAVARAVADLCVELPAGTGTLVGPLAERLDPEQAAARTVAEAAELLATLPADAWLEVVVGGPGWRDWLWDDRAGALSVAADDALPAALCAALDLGLPLARAARGARVVRVAAVDVAATVRGLLEARA